MIGIKPLPLEKSNNRSSRQKLNLRDFTVRAISDQKIDSKEMKWVAERVAHILGEKGDRLTKKEIDSVINSIRILLSKMQLLKARGFTKLARELLHPGEGHTTRSNVLVLPRRSKRLERKSPLKKVA
jgi:hypothetical protein